MVGKYIGLISSNVPLAGSVLSHELLEQFSQSQHAPVVL